MFPPYSGPVAAASQTNVTRARRAAYLMALATFRRLPVRVRRLVIHLSTPDYTVGAVVLIHRGEEVLFLSQPHRPGWSLPGGLLDAGEDAAAAVIREVSEEVGLTLIVDQPFTVVVEPGARRVDVIYAADTEGDLDISPASEAREFRWMRPQDVPETDSATRDILTAWRRAQDVPRRGVVR